ncbi:hypothetical protein NMY22_g15256 [Coprinellus aureogranulatus]|nr:hypothetical protein NMY22_g15256 [Coprinellus aureogranulatus]
MSSHVKISRAKRRQAAPGPNSATSFPGHGHILDGKSAAPTTVTETLRAILSLDAQAFASALNKHPGTIAVLGNAVSATIVKAVGNSVERDALAHAPIKTSASAQEAQQICEAIKRSFQYLQPSTRLLIDLYFPGPDVQARMNGAQTLTTTWVGVIPSVGCDCSKYAPSHLAARELAHPGAVEQRRAHRDPQLMKGSPWRSCGGFLPESQLGHQLKPEVPAVAVQQAATNTRHSHCELREGQYLTRHRDHDQVSESLDCFVPVYDDRGGKLASADAPRRRYLAFQETLRTPQDSRSGALKVYGRGGASVNPSKDMPDRHQKATKLFTFAVRTAISAIKHSILPYTKRNIDMLGSHPMPPQIFLLRRGFLTSAEQYTWLWVACSKRPVDSERSLPSAVMIRFGPSPSRYPLETILARTQQDALLAEFSVAISECSLTCGQLEELICSTESRSAAAIYVERAAIRADSTLA